MNILVWLVNRVHCSHLGLSIGLGPKAARWPSFWTVAFSGRGDLPHDYLILLEFKKSLLFLIPQATKLNNECTPMVVEGTMVIV